jgi:hypothetical protein
MPQIYISLSQIRKYYQLVHECATANIRWTGLLSSQCVDCGIKLQIGMTRFIKIIQVYIFLNGNTKKVLWKKGLQFKLASLSHRITHLVVQNSNYTNHLWFLGSFYRENAKALRFDALIENKSYLQAPRRANTAIKHNPLELDGCRDQRANAGCSYVGPQMSLISNQL